MNKKEAAIISAYTGILIGKFKDMNGYIEKIMGCAVFMHELADDEVTEEIKEKSKSDFVSIPVE